MVRKCRRGLRGWKLGGTLLGAWLLVIAVAPMSQAASPIRLGFGMAQTGGLATQGKAALLAMEIWREEVNKNGGLLGRPVEFVYYDDQSKPASVPGIYAKLLDVDQVDFVVSGYGTNLIGPAMPIIIERQRVFMGLIGLANNEKYNYPYCFQIGPFGPTPTSAQEFSRAFFALAATQHPTPRTVALIGLDGEGTHRCLAEARENLKQAGFEVIYDSTYAPATVDFTPIIRAIKATNPDVVFMASYPPDSVGMVLAAHEVGLKPKLFGGCAAGEYLFETIVGKVKFGAGGEWEKARMLLVQYQNITGTDIAQFAGPGKRVVLLPEEWQSGHVIYPYAEALK